MSDTINLVGTINISGNLNGSMNQSGELMGSIASVHSLQGSYSNIIPESEYTGAYEVTPTSSDQYLLTKNKTMTKKVTVYATPYTEVSNLYGGKTVTIL